MTDPIRLRLLALGLLVGCSSSTFSGSTGGDAQTSESDDDDEDDEDDGDGNDSAPGDGGPGDSGLGTSSEGAVGVGTDGAVTGDLADSVDAFTNGIESIQVDDDGTVLQKFAVTESITPIDVVFVIDTSGSMGEEIDKVEANLGNFLTKLIADPRSQGVQVTVMAGKNDLAFTPPPELAAVARFEFEGANNEVDSFNSLAVARGFLNGTLVSPRLKPRAGAVKHLVFVTDDNPRRVDDGSPAAIFEPEFRTYLETAFPDPGSMVIHTISCPVDNDPCASTSEAYINLANDPKYKGVVEDLRSSDWAPIFTGIANAIQAKAKLTFTLSHAAVDPSKIGVYVNSVLYGAPIAYEPLLKTVTLAPEAAKQGDVIVITYSK